MVLECQSRDAVVALAIILPKGCFAAHLEGASYSKVKTHALSARAAPAAREELALPPLVFIPKPKTSGRYPQGVKRQSGQRRPCGVYAKSVKRHSGRYPKGFAETFRQARRPALWRETQVQCAAAGHPLSAGTTSGRMSRVGASRRAVPSRHILDKGRSLKNRM